MKYFTVTILSLFCIVSSVQADAIMGKAGASALMAVQQMHEVSTADVKKHFETVGKSRRLNEKEKQFQNLLSVAYELKVEKFLSPTENASFLQPQNVTDSMVKKIQEHPKWDVALDAQIVSNITPHFDLIKNNFGPKSYGWAWFLKQRGETGEAKSILFALFEDGYKSGMQRSYLSFDGSSPLAEMQLIQSALAPMCDMRENALMNSKMQKMKSHFSNLPPSNMQT